METLLATSDTMIVPLYCTNCDPEKWLFELAPVMTAVAGGLIMARWRDLLLVALIGFLSVWFGEIARVSILEQRFAYETAPELFDPMNTLLWFAYFLVIAALVQAAQRSVVWLRSLRQ